VEREDRMDLVRGQLAIRRRLCAVKALARVMRIAAINRFVVFFIVENNARQVWNNNME
jgi:hypothetical protein